MYTNVLAQCSYFVTAREFLFTHALYQEDPQGYYKVPFARAPYLKVLFMHMATSSQPRRAPLLQGILFMHGKNPGLAMEVCLPFRKSFL